MNRNALIVSILTLTATPTAFAQTRRTGARTRGAASSAPPADTATASAAPAAEATASTAPASTAPASTAPATDTSATSTAPTDASAAPAPDATEQVTPAITESPPPPEPPPPAPVVEEHPVKFLAIEVGPVIGLNIATNPLGVGPNLGLEAGVRLHLGPGFFGVHVRGAYERYTTSGTGTLACTRMPSDGAPTGPCVSAGMYSWTLLEETVTLGLPLSYRLFDHSRIHPYVQVQPQIVLQRAQPTTFDLTNTETSTRFGILGALGAQYDIGPGAVWLEAGYRWTPVTHLSTGESTIGVVAIAVGYRFAF